MTHYKIWLHLETINDIDTDDEGYLEEELPECLGSFGSIDQAHDFVDSILDISHILKKNIMESHHDRD